MDLNTLVTLAGLAVAGVTLYSAIARTANKNHTVAMAAITENRNETKELHTDLTRRIDSTRAELTKKIDSNHAETTARLSVLEQRTYDMATRLTPPAPERHTG